MGLEIMDLRSHIELMAAENKPLALPPDVYDTRKWVYDNLRPVVHELLGTGGIVYATLKSHHIGYPNRSLVCVEVHKGKATRRKNVLLVTFTGLNTEIVYARDNHWLAVDFSKLPWVDIIRFVLFNQLVILCRHNEIHDKVHVDNLCYLLYNVDKNDEELFLKTYWAYTFKPQESLKDFVNGLNI